MIETLVQDVPVLGGAAVSGGAVGAGAMWWFINSRVTNLENRQHNHELHVAENYITRAQIKEEFDKVDKSIGKIDFKLERMWEKSLEGNKP